MTWITETFRKFEKRAIDRGQIYQGEVVSHDGSSSIKVKYEGSSDSVDVDFILPGGSFPTIKAGTKVFIQHDKVVGFGLEDSEILKLCSPSASRSAAIGEEVLKVLQSIEQKILLHIHPTPTGPSSPPTGYLPETNLASILSQKVKIP